MAKHQVKSFEVGIAHSGKVVHVKIDTELNKPYKFELTPDVHYPTVQDIAENLNKALDHCVNTFEKVNISIYKERFYVDIEVKDFIGTRFSGKAI